MGTGWAADCAVGKIGENHIEVYRERERERNARIQNDKNRACLRKRHPMHRW
jgi:hypothetical protein